MISISSAFNCRISPFNIRTRKDTESCNGKYKLEVSTRHVTINSERNLITAY